MRARIPSSAKVVVTARTAATKTAKFNGARPDDTYPRDIASTQRRSTPSRTTRANNPAQVLAIAVDPELVRERLAALNVRRQAQGCTMMALAHALGISRSTLARVPQGQQIRRGQAREFTTLEGLQRIEIALNLFARAAAMRQRGSATPAPARKRSAQPTPQAMKVVKSVVDATNKAGPRSGRVGTTSVGMQEDRQLLAPTTAIALQEGPAVRVLVVEDDAPTVDLYRLVLAEEHAIRYSMDVARTAQECLERLRGAQPYDVLLMDLGVSDMHAETDEESLLATFERLPQILPQRILVVSGISPYRLRLKRGRLAALGAAFMPKPFDVDDLLLALRSLVISASEPTQGLSFFAAPED